MSPQSLCVVECFLSSKNFVRLYLSFWSLQFPSLLMFLNRASYKSQNATCNRPFVCLILAGYKVMSPKRSLFSFIVLLWFDRTKHLSWMTLHDCSFLYCSFSKKHPNLMQWILKIKGPRDLTSSPFKIYWGLFISWRKLNKTQKHNRLNKIWFSFLWYEH